MQSAEVIFLQERSDPLALWKNRKDFISLWEIWYDILCSNH